MAKDIKDVFEYSITITSFAESHRIFKGRGTVETCGQQRHRCRVHVSWKHCTSIAAVNIFWLYQFSIFKAPFKTGKSNNYCRSESIVCCSIAQCHGKWKAAPPFKHNHAAATTPTSVLDATRCQAWWEEPRRWLGRQSRAAIRHSLGDRRRFARCTCCCRWAH